MIAPCIFVFLCFIDYREIRRYLSSQKSSLLSVCEAVGGEARVCLQFARLRRRSLHRAVVTSIRCWYVSNGAHKINEIRPAIVEL